MGKYKTRPVFVEAIQLTENVCWDYWLDKKMIFDEFTVSGSYHPGRKTISYAYIYINKEVKCNLTDWIIKDSYGNYTTETDTIFNAIYEPL